MSHWLLVDITRMLCSVRLRFSFHNHETNCCWLQNRECSTLFFPFTCRISISRRHPQDNTRDCNVFPVFYNLISLFDCNETRGARLKSRGRHYLVCESPFEYTHILQGIKCQNRMKLNQVEVTIDFFKEIKTFFSLCFSPLSPRECINV